MLQYQLHPYQAGTWADPKTKTRRPAFAFRSEWRDTLNLLERETGLLGMKGFAVIELDVHDSHIRADRQSWARARPGCCRTHPLHWEGRNTTPAGGHPMPDAKAKTPGYNRRLEIFFTSDKNGKRRAYSWSRQQYRAFPLPLADAEIMRAAETADVLCCHPMRPCTCKKDVGNPQ